MNVVTSASRWVRVSPGFCKLSGSSHRYRTYEITGSGPRGALALLLLSRGGGEPQRSS
jgi:hypothetical protein